MTKQTTPRCGDHVLHKPSGETWVVAYADPVADNLAWAGWPNGLARLSDCEITKRCSDEEHLSEVYKWRISREDDGRKSRVLRLYGGYACKIELRTILPRPEEAIGYLKGNQP